MSAYVIVEFTVKDPDVYREKYAGNAGQTAKTKERRFSPITTGRSSMALPCSRQGSSCSFRTMRRPSGGTTRPTISS